MTVRDDVVIPGDPVGTAQRVRQLRGMESFNPGRIEGFGDNEPPPPDFDNPYPPVAPAPEPPIAPTYISEVATSPLVPRTAVEAPRSVQHQHVHGVVVQEGVMVLYNGTPIVEPEVLLAVERVVLQGVERGIRRRLKEMKPRRRSVAMGTLRGAPPVVAVASPSKRKGRPKGSRNKAKPDAPPVDATPTPGG